jgi:5-methylcytosine-specific restriction protein A
MPQRIEFIRPQRANYKVRRAENRPNAYQRGYCDKRHRAWRAAVLLRDNWTCRSCGVVIWQKRRAHADHIVSIADGGDRYDVANGQCLCASCHQRKTNDERERRNGG